MIARRVGEHADDEQTTEAPPPDAGLATENGAPGDKAEDRSVKSTQALSTRDRAPRQRPTDGRGGPASNADGSLLPADMDATFQQRWKDPDPTGWYSPDTGNEVGDNCQWAGRFAPLGLSNPNAYTPVLGGNPSAGTLFDQMMNGEHFYTQSEWSNGDGTCELKPRLGTIGPRITPPRGRIAAHTSLRFTSSASSSTYPYSSATWSFGDGSTSRFFKGRSALAPATHAYAAPGSYTVTLTLADNRGNVRTTTHAVTVVPLACVVPNVKGESPRRATEAIRAARCAVAKVRIQGRHGRLRAKLVVARQSPSAGAVRPRGTSVRLTLVFKPARHSAP